MDIKSTHYIQSLLVASLTFLPHLSSAASLTLPNSPLFLSNSVDPNIFYIIDDSGSMEFETLMRNGVAGIYANDGDPYVRQDGTTYDTIEKRYVIPDWANGRDGNSTDLTKYEFTVPSTNIWSLAWVARTHHGNAIYYNPDIDYKPWPGTNADGTPLYQPVTDVTAVMLDPNDLSVGTIDLTAPINFKVGAGSQYRNTKWVDDTLYPATYYEWDDDKVNGEVGVLEAGEKGDKIEIRNEVSQDADGNTITIGYGAGPYPGAKARMYDAEIKNFANWFQYHRKRSYVAKNAIGYTLLNTDNVRSGYSVFNDYYKPGKTYYTSDSTYQPYTIHDLNTPTHKLGLLKHMYQHLILCGKGKDGDGDGTKPYPDICNGTPGLTALDNVGQLFSGTLAGHSSPILNADKGGECQQNYTVFLSDGYWSQNSPPSGINDADTDQSQTQVNGFDGGRFADDHSVTLADVAMHYYEHDLSALANNVPKIAGIDEATHQHLVTYTIALGLEGTMTEFPKSTDTSFDWPDASTSTKDERKVDDLWHAAYNARGKYLDASNPTELQTALSAAIEDIADRTAIAAAVAVNSARLTEESVVYVAQFNSNRWQGSLAAYAIEDTNLGTLSSTPNWRAEEKLDARTYTTDSSNSSYRNIVTYNGTTGVPFTSAAYGNPSAATPTNQLSDEMVADLRTNPSGGTDNDATALARLEYLRGDTSYELSYGFRSRLSLLGDIVNSGPVFVGKSDLAWPDVDPFPSTAGERYSDFKNGASSSRDQTVYVGANDGFLHAFDGSSGEEIFAYAPNILASSTSGEGYHYLTDPNYVHQWYVDLTPTISDVSLTTGFGSGWHTILVGGLRGGGRGLYALDITNPDNLTDTNADKIVLWEFSSDDNADLGYTYSRPVIAMANNNHWVAIFGNGYNDLGSGEAKLFILDIEAGIDGWSTGDFKVISTGAGDSTDRNGLASPALVDTDGNGTVDRVYAGDLKGNMWVFDLSSSNTAQWDVAYKDSGSPVALINTGKPITAKPVLAKHPTIPYAKSPSNAPNLMVYFGTGQYLQNTDISDTSTQSYYGVWDQGDPLTTGDLIKQTITTTGDLRFISRNQVDYSTDHGWWFDLTENGDSLGERSVTNSIARGGVVFFNTFVPESDACTVGGYGWQYAVDMATGGSTLEAVTDYNNSGTVTKDDLVGGKSVAGTRGSGYQPEPVFIEDLKYTGDDPEKVEALPDVPEGRFSWQELIK